MPASAKWREFFRCGLSRKRKDWEEAFRIPYLRDQFEHRIAKDYLDRLAHQLKQQQVHLKDQETGEIHRGRSLIATIDECVENHWLHPNTVTAKYNQRAIIGALRHCLATVSLDFLEPDLIILDEFQRFKEILDNADQPGTVEAKLFAKKRVGVLILSATPYKMYTLSHEKEEDHYEDFLRTYRFLARCDNDSEEVQHLKRNLARFRDRLLSMDNLQHLDQELLETKRSIEDQLKMVMCRTERSRYILDARKGIKEVPTDGFVDGILPRSRELLEYVQLRRFLLGTKERAREYGANVMDFWKSGPSILTFMDSHYALIRNLRANRDRIPTQLLLPENELPTSYAANLKCRLLFAKVFDLSPETANQYVEQPDQSGEWKYLWTRPTFTYYADEFFGNVEPHKFLLFSHWRFVPKTVAYLVSGEAERRLGRVTKLRIRTPLKFGDRVSFYLCDICFPSFSLALNVDLLRMVGDTSGRANRKELLVEAEKIITRMIHDAGITVGPSGTSPLWERIARLEAKSPFVNEIADAVKSSGVLVRDRSTGERTSERYDEHRDRYHDFLNESDRPLRVTKKEIRRMARIALFSPAVNVLRAIATEFIEDLSDEQAVKQFAKQHLGSIYNLCVNQVRNYFNRDLVQAVIRRHGGRGSYIARVLKYCALAHFPAVIDEYVYLLRNVLQNNKPKDLVEQLGRVLGMYSGSPNINCRSPGGALQSVSQPMTAHFALAYGEDVVMQDEVGVQQKSRQSHVREAFNSPFWPFVLATTSVGQEGLDFHLYCEDIVHWNLPSNPIDLEQREGRLNRYDGLVVRRNIARDYPLASLLPAPTPLRKHIWKRVFEAISKDPKGAQKYRHGLFPHWLYEPQVGEPQLLRRHLLFYSQSDDMKRYHRLKHDLALYRLVFGQPRQQDVVTRIREKLTGDAGQLDDSALARLPAYMIDLSPFEPEHAWRSAQAEAEQLLLDATARRRLIREVQEMLGKKKHLVAIERELNELTLYVERSGHNGQADTSQIAKAIAALAYVRNPYDAVYDFFEGLGFEDDIAIVKEAHRDVFGAPCISPQ